MNKIRLRAYKIMNHDLVPGTTKYKWWVKYRTEEQLNMLEKHQQNEITDDELLEYARNNRYKS